MTDIASESAGFILKAMVLLLCASSLEWLGSTIIQQTQKTCRILGPMPNFLSHRRKKNTLLGLEHLTGVMLRETVHLC